MRPSNQEIEKYYFEKFQALYELPEGEIVFGDRPDVIIRGKSKLGIELTNFYTDPTGTEQSQISMRLNAAKKAQKKYQEKVGKNIEYTFGFDRAFPIQKVSKMAESLALLAERFAGRAIGQVSKEDFEDVPEISFVWRGGKYTDCEWRVSQVFSTPIMDKNRLVEIIKEKEKKATEYAVCDELWLLIVIDFIDLAQDQEIMNVQLDEIESGIFDRVTIYKTGIEQIREVPIKSTK
ncbi:MAG: hypothetical protein EBQ96_07590 [Proteobacteria bacterium]|nr:hypothetical protein [Pseudomonadota bacterium]